ncbi:MAG: hypothetical protein WAW88_10665 [Nocardioides sp.]
MTSERFAQAVGRHLASRLHQSSTGYRCRCGGCLHQILATARRTGLPAARLVAALPPEAPKEKKGRRATGRRPLSGQVASSMTVTRGRRRLQGPTAILAVVGNE